MYTGGTSILMAKVLERYDASWSSAGVATHGTTTSGSGGGGSSAAGAPGGGGPLVRRLWAADSFEGTPAPVEQDAGGDPGMRSG